MVRNSGGSDGRRVKSVQKSFNIIETLDERGSATVSELSEALDMPISTVHVYLQTLTDTGYIIRQGREYTLGLRFLETGSRVRNRLNVLQAARQEMVDLCWQTGERVGLGVAEGGKRVQLWQIEGEDAINDNNFIGEFTHMHWTSLGKVLLASFNNAQIEDIIERHGLPRATKRTIVEADELFKEIDQIRNQGYAIEDEEHKLGMRSVSVPLPVSEENTIGALGIAAAKSRVTPQKCNKYVNRLKNKANIISILYNHQGVAQLRH
jgi:DNA-binding IclR family transcriptional regulator